MKRIVLTCETVTPMFMYGADGRTPELRPSELKGMMRFWWRAAKGEDNIEKLKNDEFQIFGGVGNGGRKSKVNLRVIFDKNSLHNNVRYDLRTDPKIKSKQAGSSFSLQYPGISYLLYSTILEGKKTSYVKNYIKDGFSFTISITSFDPNTYEQVIAAFWLAVYLGGFGTRSRRGAGNIMIKNVSGDDTAGISFVPTVGDSDHLKEWFDSNIEKIRSAFNFGTTSKYSTLAGSQLLIFNPQRTWFEALEHTGRMFADFRRQNKSMLWESAAFGMPVIHRRSGVKMVPCGTHGKLSDRFSSPIIFKVIKSQNLFFPLVLKLNVNMNKIGKEEGHNVHDIKTADMSKVDEFLELVKNDEVKEILI
ncbi:MAG TPA: type III-B CRISPR module RAMP protein Cmr1 [Fervidobacterium sp.]|nr:type III-B CRISPR module RAMP protein Cmr1 [Fervidobacterium sp.]